MKTVYCACWLLLVFLLSETMISAENLSEKEKERKKLAEKFDRLKLRGRTEFVIDCSEEFLKEPPVKPTAGEFTVAQVPPTVKMMILPDKEPEFFPEGEQYSVGWSNWAYVTRSEDNRFFFAAGDHRGNGCQLNLYEYCPGRDLVHKVLDVDELLGWTEKSYTDGKIHGQMGIMADGTLWAATHYGVKPDSSWWANGYRGSWLFSYNIYTHEAKNWGVPLIGNNLYVFSVDTRRGRLVGTGDLNNTVLCWDCINKKATFAGYMPNGWTQWRFAMMCDRETGEFWNSEYGSDGTFRFMSFDPGLNKFERYDVFSPENPYTHETEKFRGYTERPAVDGWYYGATWNGVLFRFKPEGPQGPIVESAGVTWDKGKSLLQMGLSPSGRYVYYLLKEYPAPLVQYDVVTGKRKALCWLQDYYFEKYGYWMDECFGMEISKDGSFIVAVQNGAFRGRGITHGHPSILVISIPEKERPFN